MSDGTTAYDLSAKLHPVHPQQQQPRVNRPGNANYWLIPAAVLGSIALWVAVGAVLARDTNPTVSTTELVLLIAAGVVTISTVLVAKEYLIHKAMSDDHAAIREDVADLRAQLVVIGAENRALLEQISLKGDKLKELYWEDFAQEAKQVSGVVPFGRRTR